MKTRRVHTIMENDRPGRVPGRMPLVVVLALFLGASLWPMLPRSAQAQVNGEVKHSATQPEFLERLENDDQFGNAVATLGDLDGNGVDDIAVGAWHDGFGGLYHGAVWILFLNDDGTVKFRQMIGDRRGGFDVTLDTADVFGYSLAGLGDIDGDGVPDLAVGSPTDDDGGDARGAVYILFLRSDGTVKSYQKISDTQGGFGGVLHDTNWFGYSVASIPDLDGNTVDDLVVGAGWDNDGGTKTGAVWVLFLDSTGTVINQQKISPLEGGLTAVLDDNDYFGSSVATIGDIDGDLVPDIAVGAENDDDGAGDAGAVYVLFMNSDGTVKAEQKISNGTGQLPAGLLSSVDAFGCSVAALGDYDGDGVEDIVVGAHSWAGPGGYGGIWVLFLNDDGTVKTYQEITQGVGGLGNVLEQTDHFGSGVAVVHGFAGDAVPDFVVGTERDDDGGTDRGAAWVLFMDPAGTTLAQQKISDTTGGFNELLSEGDNYGSAVATIGDLNGDGVIDVAVGAQGDDNNRGAVWILFMNPNATVHWHQKIGDGAGAFDGVLDPLDQFGSSITALGDLDGDGTEDIAVGAPLDDDGGTPPNANRGAVWVLFLNPDGTVKTTHKIADNVGGFESPLADGDLFGYSIAFLGDIDSDGLLYELAVGAINDDDGGTSRGAVYILSIFDDGTCDSAQKISSLAGGFGGALDDNDFFGSSLAPVGDLDGDGVVDLAVGAIGDDDGGVPPNADRGALWLLFLQTDRTIKTSSKISDTAGYFTGALGDNAAFGYSVASLGDLDGDGTEDIVVGSPNAAGLFGGVERGAVWILFLDGPSGGAVKTYAEIADSIGGFPSVLSDFDWLGTSVTSLGDINSNGLPDMMVGASGTDDGGNEAGAGWVLSLDLADPDGDGVYYGWDQCPDEDASYFDWDRDGCRDAFHGGRHVEYWDSSTAVSYYIELDAAPNITDGSDFTALQEAMAAWPALPGARLVVSYHGTTDVTEALPLDGMNLITFKDPVMNKDTGALFGSTVLAVGIATSFTEPTFYDGKFYRPGEIVDADMLFNPAKNFKTDTAGSGKDLQSIAVHEAGHLYGLSHSAVHSSTMFAVLLGGEAARTPETEDSLLFVKSYPDFGTLGLPRYITGIVSDGATGDPVPNAAVFAIDAASGDTVAHDITTELGRYSVAYLNVGEYKISIHPLDGSADAGYLTPAGVNFLSQSWGETDFIPEYYNAQDSPFEEPDSQTTILLLEEGGDIADIQTNIDIEPPEIASVSPDSNSVDVLVNTAVVIGFSEEIDYTTIQGNFRLENKGTGTAVGGTGTVYQDGLVLSFVPWGALEYATTYRCSLATGIEDKFGNGLAAPVAFDFLTEAEPPLHVDALIPDRGVAGSVIVITGAGFDPDPANNVVRFTDTSGSGTVTVVPISASPTQLVANVHPDAGTGGVDVIVGPSVSNELPFSVLPPVSVSRGFEAGSHVLSALPRALTLLPNNIEACVTTASGLSIVNVDPGSPGFLTETTIPIANGLREIDATPDGHYAFATNRLDSVVYMIDVQSQTVSHMLDVGAEPVGVVVGPVGNRAYIATSAGGIQVWDLVQASPTYLTPLKTIESPDASLRGKMAIDPTGDYLVVPSGAGKLLAFDVGPDTFLVDVSVGPDPRDVVIDPTGQRAYVSDGSGEVTIVSVGGFFKIIDIPTGGALRGVAITPTGLHLYAANRELNVLDVIDLNETSPTYRTVAATHTLGINPVDTEVSPDGNYAVSLVEAEQRIVVTGIGVGPVLKSMSRRAAPAGGVLVFVGEGFSPAADSMRVVFTDEAGGTVVAPVTRSTGRAVTAAVPATAADGPVIVERAHPPGYQGSNALYFDRLYATPAPGQLRETTRYPLAGTAADVMAMSPLGDQLVVGTNDGIMFVDTDPNSVTYQQPIGSTTLSTAAPSDIVFTPDGKRAFVCFPTSVSVINTDKTAAFYQTRIDTFDILALPQLTELTEMAVSPDGEVCLLYDNALSLVWTVDVYPGSPNEYVTVDTIMVDDVTEIAYNPSGTHAFMTFGDPVPGSITSVDMDSSSVNFRKRVSTLLLESPTLPGVPTKPLSLSFFPDGERCLVLTSLATDPDHRVFLLDTSVPTSIGYVADTTYGFGPPVNPDYPAGQRTDVSPRADRAVFHQNGTGLFGFEVNPSGFGSFQLFDSDVQSVGAVDQDYSIDGSFLYSISTWGDTLQIFTYEAPDSAFKVAGDFQTGAVDDKLPAPLKVRVMRGATPSEGVPVTFNIVSGGGVFAGTGTAAQVAVTSSAGYAQVEWVLGSTVGTQSVSASVVGAVGSPLTFTAAAVPDPNSLPLELVQVSPADGAVGVAVTTTILATFSRAVDSVTVDTTSFYFHKSGVAEVVAAKLAFTDGYRKVSLSPYAPLEFSSAYELAVSGDIKDTSNGSLDNPQTISFATESAPQLELTSVSPPSGTVTTPLVLGGVSFNPVTATNIVYFNNVEATPFEGGLDYLKVAVPPGAVTGDIRVYNGSQNSNTLPFTVLVPSNATSDEVVATVGTGAATKSVTINPDGSMAYAVSPDAGVVIPIDVESQTSLPAIQVGSTPVSIDIHPDGHYVYVANFNSNTVSIIDTDPNSPNYHKLVGTLATGNYPLDVVASPLGDRVYVVTADPDTTQNVDIIDADENSANHNTVVATVGAGSGVKSVTINPDGSLLYVGNDDGYVVLDASDYSYTVIADVSTGKTTKSMTINPDGSLLVILTADGDVLIVDIVDGSANENTVIATVKGGSSTKSVTINPDGTLLYLVQEENDEILVFELNIVGGVSVIDPGASLPAFGVETTLIDTIYAGEDPEAMVFDPRGTGAALVTNSGPETVTILNTGFVDIELATDTIMIPGYSQVPTIDLGGLGIKNTSDRDFTYSYAVSTTGPCTLQGGTLANPSSPGGRPYSISGRTTSISGFTPTLAPSDSFATQPFVLDVPAVREKLEQVVTYRVSTTEDPNLEELASVLVVITPPVPVFVHRFDAVPLDAGVELSWDVAADEGIVGFKILRRDVDTESGAFGIVTEDIAADANRYIDRDTRAGREYEYTLGIVLDNGEEALSQPVRVTTKSFKLALFQNYPNPFNPKTTIAFTLPAKQHVTLTIFNVAGQRVTTLVDGVLSEGYKKYEWGGVNSSGNPVGSGVYFYRLRTGKRTLTKKMILLK